MATLDVGGEAFDDITALFSGFTNRFQQGRFSNTIPSLQPLHGIVRGQNLLGGRPLSGIEMLLLFVGDCLALKVAVAGIGDSLPCTCCELTRSCSSAYS